MRRPTLPTSPAAVSLVRPRRSEYVSRPPRQPLRSPWLMFLRAGGRAAARVDRGSRPFHPDNRHVWKTPHAQPYFASPASTNCRAPGVCELLAVVRAAIVRGPRPEQGLLIARRLYDAVGGHSAGDDAEAAILRRLGRTGLRGAARFDYDSADT